MPCNFILRSKIFICTTLSFYFFNFKANSQCLTKDAVIDSISIIESNLTFTPANKLERFYNLKNILDKCNSRHDSVYSNVLLKIARYEVNVSKNFATSINYINASIKINKTGRLGSSKYFLAKSYYSMATNYYKLSLFEKALQYFDSTILILKNSSDTTNYTLYSRLYKAYLFFQIGDYQKAVEESTSGIDYALKEKDTSTYLELLIQRAQSFYYQGNISQSLSDVNILTSISTKNNYLYKLASALKIKASIFEKNHEFKKAASLFKRTIYIRVQTKDTEQIANDYIDYGNFYLDSLNNNEKAKQCYLQTIYYGKKIQDSTLLARANTNIGELYLKQKNYKLSSHYCIKALAYLNILIDDIYKNPSSDKLNTVETKEMALVIMNNKVETLLKIYLSNKDNRTLFACLQTALVMDTLITKMRNMQLGNESKLYWRNYTRDFYTNAVEACYLDNNSALAFYFIEKSRAVLLNDKLNELSASSYLSIADAAKQDDYQVKIIELEQKLSDLNGSSGEYQAIQSKLLDVKNDFEQYAKSLEIKYPAYYQYKYADDVSTLPQLQSYLKKNNQSFVQYFLGDTVTYILAITPASTKFICLSQKDFKKEQLSKFLQLCADKEMLMSHYDVFASLSNSIYKTIFQPLKLPPGRLIICSDNIVIPFDALCLDKTGRNFLLNNYNFSYVYSVRSLIKSFYNKANAKGSFIGFAPVSFATSLNVQDLKNAADALQASSSYYSTKKLFTYQNATRSNFFKYACSYSITNIFSHAHADTTDEEPVLYMHDSLIHLSELQLLNNPATKLVLLSACQTNVGKTATGEGIYSLARGFATAGIPSVSATLWKADEQTIYTISERFNQYLSKGMNKDEALKKAKLYFINSNTGNDKLLPYYWANMIVIGNTDAIQFPTTGNSYFWWFAACIVLFLFIALIILWKIFLKEKCF